MNAGETNILLADSNEWMILVATARIELDDFWASELDRLLRQPVNWDLLISQSVIHGTVGLLLRHLSGVQAKATVPEDVFERLRALYMRITVSNMQQLDSFRKVAERLKEAGVQIIVLKGAVLAERLYGDIGLRPMSDVDLIVHERDWPEVSRVLKEFDFRSYGQELGPLPPKLTRYDVQSHVQLLSPAETCLEFQFDLFTLGIGMLDMAGVWIRSREADVGGAHVRMLGAEDQLLHLLIHANRHGCSRLKWLVDVAESLRQNGAIDWGLLESIARREGVSVIIYQTLTYIQDLLRIQLVDPSILACFKPALYQRAAWRLLWPRKRLDEFHGRAEDGICYYFYRPFSGWNLFNYVLTGRVKDKLAYQARWIAPSLDWMSQTYGQPKAIGLLKYYPRRLFNRKGKFAARH